MAEDVNCVGVFDSGASLGGLHGALDLGSIQNSRRVSAWACVLWVAFV